MYKEEAQWKASTVASQLTGLLLIQIARLNTHNICAIFLVMLPVIVHIDLVGFLEISYPIPFMTCIVMEVFEGEQLSNIPLFDFEYITMKGGMSVIKVSCFQLGWFNRSNV